MSDLTNQNFINASHSFKIKPYYYVLPNIPFASHGIGHLTWLVCSWFLHSDMKKFVSTHHIEFSGGICFGWVRVWGIRLYKTYTAFRLMNLLEARSRKEGHFLQSEGCIGFVTPIAFIGFTLPTDGHVPPYPLLPVRLMLVSSTI